MDDGYPKCYIPLMIGELVQGMLKETFGDADNGQGTVYGLSAITLGGINATGSSYHDREP